MRRLVFTLAAVFTMAIGLSAQSTAQSGSRATLGTVNSEPITEADLDWARQGHADAALGSLLVDVVDDRVLEQRGKNLGYAVSDDQMKAVIQNVKRLNGITSDEQLDAALQQEAHLTRTQWRSILERGAIASRVLGTDGLAQVSDEDARKYFDSHLDEFPLQTFESAKPDVIARMAADRATRKLVFKSYLQSLRNNATVVWTEPGLQQAYEQAAR